MSITEFDRDHVWHPYTTVPAAYELFEVVGCEGAYLELANGQRILDGMASWWSAIHGYANPRLIEAVTQQAQRFAHVMFGGLTHAPAVELAQRLVELTPASLEKVFLSDSGSVSVEVAIKMALQYQLGKGRKGRYRLAALRGGYHGDTCGAMAVCDPVNGMHAMFDGYLPDHCFLPRPTVRPGEDFEEKDFEAYLRILDQHQETLAGVILEPMVQGAGGMWFYHADYLKHLRRWCDRHDVPLIYDEIATGFGRTGKMFAIESSGVTPDILCLGKAMTGGMMSLAACVHARVASFAPCVRNDARYWRLVPALKLGLQHMYMDVVLVAYGFNRATCYCDVTTLFLLFS